MDLKKKKLLLYSLGILLGSKKKEILIFVCSLDIKELN